MSFKIGELVEHIKTGNLYTVLGTIRGSLQRVDCEKAYIAVQYGDISTCRSTLVGADYFPTSQRHGVKLGIPVMIQIANPSAEDGDWTIYRSMTDALYARPTNEFEWRFSFLAAAVVS